MESTRAHDAAGSAVTGPAKEATAPATGTRNGEAGASAPHPRACIYMVGVSRPGPTDIVPTLVGDILAQQPEFIGLMCTPDSRATADRIVEAIAGRIGRQAVEVLPDGVDLNAIFLALNAMIRTLGQQGIRTPEISINYTSGTKVMAAGAVLSAVFNECESLRYLVAGDQPGTSRPIMTPPAAVHAARELAWARRLALELRFFSAQEILRETNLALLAEGERRQIARLLKVLAGYGAWDNFHYETAIRFFEEAAALTTDGGAPEPVDLGPALLDGVRRIGAAVREDRFSVDLLADLYNNAMRRIRENKPNDAVARAYRLLEMLAQQKLAAVYQVDTENVDPKKVPPRTRGVFEAMRSSHDGKIRAGLRKSFDLLNALDDPLGAVYSRNDRLLEILTKRYRSILAHGVTPLGREEAGEFVREVASMVMSEYPNFPRLCEELQFPWLKLAE